MSKNNEFILDTLRRVEAARGVKQKVSVLQDAGTIGDDEQVAALHKVLQLAYDANIRFGINGDSVELPVTHVQPSEMLDISEDVLAGLDAIRLEPRTTVKAAILSSLMARMEDAETAKLLRNIVNKDLRVGISESTVNKAFPGLLSEFGVMLAKPFETRYAQSWPRLVEPKLDGLRVIAEVDTLSEEVRFLTRSGKPIDSLDTYKTEVLAVAKHLSPNGIVVFDGEVTSGSFLESMSSVRSSKEQATDATYHVFDVLVGSVARPPLAQSDQELQGQGTQMERRQRLREALAKETVKFFQLTDGYLTNSVEEVYQIYNACRDAGLEGVIVKDPKAHYVKKRSASWLKIKAEETEDLEIVGGFEGTGQFAGALGGLIVKRGEVTTEVGSGFSAEQRRDFWEALQSDQRLVADGKFDRLQLIGIPAEIQFQEVMPSGKLRHPVFVRLRRDKSATVGAF